MAIETVEQTRATVGRLVLRAVRVPGALVSMRAWWLGGSRLEPKPGLALITGRGLGEGTTRRSWRQLALDTESRGMALQAAAGTEAQAVSIDALAIDLDEALETFVEVVREPAFPDDRMRWLGRQAAAERDSMLDSPETRTHLAFLDQIYRPHPYGRPMHGVVGDLEAIEPADCADFHRRCLAWGGVIAVVGEIDPAATLDRLSDVFADLGDLADEPPPPAAPDDSAPSRQEVLLDGTDQAQLCLGHRTVPHAHPDGPALDVASVILGAGAGLAGRLPERVREREGLAYAVDISAAIGAGLEAGRLSVYVGTAPERLDQAERAVREELERMVVDGVTDREVAEARAYLIGRDPFRRETLRQRAERIAESEVYGLPDDRPGFVAERLAEVDRAAVDAATRRWIRPADLKVTIGRPRSTT